MLTRRTTRARARTVVVDLGASRVACGVFRRMADGGLRLEDWSTEVLSAGCSGEVEWLEETVRALAKLALNQPLAGSVVLSLPGHVALTRFVKTPAVAPAKRERIMAFEAAQNIPYPLDGVAWDHGVRAEEAGEIEVMLAAAKRETMATLCEATERVGITTIAAVPSCVGFERGVRFNYPELSEGVLAVNIGARSTHLWWLDAGRFRGRTLGLGGGAVTEAIARELNIGRGEAERLKRVPTGEFTKGLPSAMAVRRAGDAFVARVESEIRRSLLNFGRKESVDTPARMMLAGGGSMIEGLREALERKFRCRVERYDSLRRVAISPLLDASRVRAEAWRLAELVGLASGGQNEVDEAGARPNLMPVEWVQARAFRRRQPVWWAIAAMVVVGFLPAIWHFERKAVEGAERVAEVETRVRFLRAVAEERAREVAEVERVRGEIAALRGALAAQTSWSAFLADLQSRLAEVEDAWLEELSVLPLGERVEGSEDLPAVKLRMSGSLLHEEGEGGAKARDRAQRLLASVARSPFVAAIEEESFEASGAHVLAFRFTLRANPEKRL